MGIQFPEWELIPVTWWSRRACCRLLPADEADHIDRQLFQVEQHEELTLPTLPVAAIQAAMHRRNTAQTFGEHRR
ncbi:MAG: hypothetical protein M3Y35_12950 [Actinomycetota bacterium]|nr:hypothetical protein [Actinomycetota bacterium]